MYQDALFKVIKYFGSQESLAKAIGVKQQSVSHWLNREHSIPYKHVLKIVAATKGYVTHHELAPHEKALNKIIDDFAEFNKNKIIQIPIAEIKIDPQQIIHNEFLCHYPEIPVSKEALSQPLLIDKNYQLLTCDCRLRLHKKLGNKDVMAIIVREVIYA